MEETQHPLKPVLERDFIQPITELRDSFNPFVEMTDRVIDQKALLLSPPEFMISPSYNETLQGIADRRNVAYDEIARLFAIVLFGVVLTHSTKIDILILISNVSITLGLGIASEYHHVIIMK